MKLKDAQDTMIGIITAVEAGVLSPAEAVEDVTHLNYEAKKVGLSFKADYTLGDFILIHENAAATYEVEEDRDKFLDGEDEEDESAEEVSD